MMLELSRPRHGRRAEGAGKIAEKKHVALPSSSNSTVSTLSTESSLETVSTQGVAVVKRETLLEDNEENKEENDIVWQSLPLEDDSFSESQLSIPTGKEIRFVPPDFNDSFLAASNATANQQEDVAASSRRRRNSSRHCRSLNEQNSRRSVLEPINDELIDMKKFWAAESEEAARQNTERREAQHQYLRWQQCYSIQRYQKQFQLKRQLGDIPPLSRKAVGEANSKDQQGKNDVKNETSTTPATPQPQIEAAPRAELIEEHAPKGLSPAVNESRLASPATQPQQTASDTDAADPREELIEEHAPKGLSPVVNKIRPSSPAPQQQQTASASDAVAPPKQKKLIDASAPNGKSPAVVKVRPYSVVKRQLELDDKAVSLIEVYAPKGKLGIVLVGPESPAVVEIKPSSVLKDHIQFGDKVISLNGEDTRMMTAKQVSKIINQKKDENRKFRVIRTSGGGPDC